MKFIQVTLIRPDNTEPMKAAISLHAIEAIMPDRKAPHTGSILTLMDGEGELKVEESFDVLLAKLDSIQALSQ